MHTPPLEHIIDNSLMSSLAIAAVPVFFAITGYFLHSDDETQLISKSRSMLYKVFKTWLATNLIYFLYKSLLGHQPFPSWSSVGDFFILGMNNEGVLWYLLALLYTLIILHIIFLLRVHRLVYYLPILLFPTILLGRYSFVLGSEYSILSDFNFLMNGLPYVSLGFFIRKYQHQFLHWNWEVFTLLFLILNAIEVAALADLAQNYFGRYLFTMPLVVSIFCLFLKNPNFGRGSSSELIGRKYAGNIYYFHWLVIYALRFFFDRLGVFDAYYQHIGFIYVFLITLLLAYLIVKIQDKLGWHILR